MQTENKSLNTYVKQQLVQILFQKGVIVTHVGNQDLYTITVKKVDYTDVENTKQEIYKFRHSNGRDVVLVGENCVANVEGESSADVNELRNALFNTIEQQNVLRKMEFDRRNMTVYDIRAVEFLNRFQR